MFYPLGKIKKKTSDGEGGGGGGGWEPPPVVRPRIKTPEDIKSETKSTSLFYSFFIA